MVLWESVEAGERSDGRDQTDGEPDSLVAGLVVAVTALPQGRRRQPLVRGQGHHFAGGRRPVGGGVRPHRRGTRSLPADAPGRLGQRVAHSTPTWPAANECGHRRRIDRDTGAVIAGQLPPAPSSAGYQVPSPGAAPPVPAPGSRHRWLYGRAAFAARIVGSRWPPARSTPTRRTRRPAVPDPLPPGGGRHPR
jgi:hypothetical protein